VQNAEMKSKNETIIAIFSDDIKTAVLFFNHSIAIETSTSIGNFLTQYLEWSQFAFKHFLEI